MEQGVTKENRLRPARGASSAGGQAGGQHRPSPDWAAGLCQPSQGVGEEGYLGASGGICSRVGEVSMIRTSSRSM